MELTRKAWLLPLLFIAPICHAKLGFSTGISGEGSGKQPVQARAAAEANLKRNCKTTYDGIGVANNYNVYSNSGQASLGFSAMAFGTCSYQRLEPPHIYGFNKKVAPTAITKLWWDADYSKKTEITLPMYLGGTDEKKIFGTADFNGDGTEDYYVFSRSNTGSGTTEVHVIDGRNPQNFLLQTPTPLHETGTGSDYKFLLADRDRDNVPDVYVIKKNGGNGKTEIHILDGAANYTRFNGQFETALTSTGNDVSFDFALGGWENGVSPDLYVITKMGQSNTTEVHILTSVSDFKTYKLHATTGLGVTGNDNSYSFNMGDYNHDGRLDLYAVRTSNADAEVLVYDGSTGFKTLLLAVPTPAQTLGKSKDWQFVVGTGM
ncbi:FG-GAP repeat domain-containing protein [Xanthomonas hortorum]|uniref:FG-GAP repeat domain-containing protein n=1 Tax=Xanthomonas hortorum TaxID=56454 RepID=UPI000A9CE249|nr:VCBS repeat-containing protein [Xanthomonas hortorum]